MLAKTICISLLVGAIAVGEAIADTSVVSYAWVEPDMTSSYLEQEFGVDIVKVQVNGIDTGERYELFKGVWVPVYKQGVQIWFEEQPTVKQLEELDLVFSQQDWKREGGKGLVERMEELEGKVHSLERSK